jgi:hypothetical protein
VAHRVPLDQGGRPVLLAGDGGAYAAVAYVLPVDGGGAAAASDPGRAAPGCRLALVDLRTGRVVVTHPACAARDLATGLALWRTPAGPVAFLALWSRAETGAGGRAPAGARIMAVQALTGRVLEVAPLAGLPRPAAAGGSLVLAPGPDGRIRLYCVEALPGSELATWGETEYGWQFPLSGAWHVLPLTPDRLEPERPVPLAFPPSGLAVAPDGAAAYAFDALGDALLRIDLATGRTTAVASVPGHQPAGLVVAGDRLYASIPQRGQVWGFERQRGARVQVLRAGRQPTGIGLAS